MQFETNDTEITVTLPRSYCRYSESAPKYSRWSHQGCLSDIVLDGGKIWQTTASKIKKQDTVLKTDSRLG